MSHPAGYRAASPPHIMFRGARASKRVASRPTTAGPEPSILSAPRVPAAMPALLRARAAARCINVMAGLVFASAGAFSAAQSPAASRGDASATTATEASGAAPISIALVLPLEAPAFARAAEAVRAGVPGSRRRGRCAQQCTGHLASRGRRARGLRGRARVWRDGDRRPAAARRRQVGSATVPGVAADRRAEPVSTSGIEQPPNFYTFALAIESDARVIARRLQAEAVQNVAVVNADTPLMHRFAEAFGARMAVGGRLRAAGLSVRSRRRPD